MYIKCDFSFNELRDACWSGAVDTLNNIAEAGLEDEFMSLMEDWWCGDMPELTNVNDWLWFDSEDIYVSLGLDEDGNVPNEDEDDEDEEDEE